MFDTHPQTFTPFSNGLPHRSPSPQSFPTKQPQQYKEKTLTTPINQMKNPTQSSSPPAPTPASSDGRRRSNSGPTPCCTKVGMKRGPWTPEEDEKLSKFVAKEGEGRWRTLPKRAGLSRCGKSCRLRWMNYLRPSIKRGPIAPDEEDLILRLHRLLGNRWSLIAGRIPGRTDNEIKNYWNTHLSKKLINKGIDPRTHRPFAVELDRIDTVKPNKIQRSAPAVANPNYSSLLLDENPNCTFHDSNGDDQFAMLGEQSSDGVGLRLDCETDVLFSSFLDSLMNEDFDQQQRIDCDNKNSNTSAHVDPFGASTSFAGFELEFDGDKSVEL